MVAIPVPGASDPLMPFTSRSPLSPSEGQLTPQLSGAIRAGYAAVRAAVCRAAGRVRQTQQEADAEDKNRGNADHR
jgi:hypothetical protein